MRMTSLHKRLLICLGALILRLILLQFVGLSSVIFPNEDRDTIIEVAKRYSVDYLLMPPNRASLNGLLTSEMIDPRFIFVANAPGTHFSFYAIEDTDDE